MYQPSLPFFRSVVHAGLKSIKTEPIKSSSTPAAVYRLWLENSDDKAPRSVIVKRISQHWPEDDQGDRREMSFYAHLLPKLDIPQPHIYYAGKEPETGQRLVIMEDLHQSHRFPRPTHIWSQVEIEQILRTYARLHAAGESVLAAEGELDWLFARHEKRLQETAQALPGLVEKLMAEQHLPPLANFETLLDRTLRLADHYSDQPVTVLHNDVYPPNCGLATKASGDVILLDWEMAGYGLAEMDLGFMFLQPFGSHRELDRQAAMDCYWDERQRLAGYRPDQEERRRRQWYADALWALWLIPVAYRMFERPFPPGCPPRIYWQSMIGVLGRRLEDLCREAE
jgi:aminoglycoside phosphotransferase (APT) family kinase protein